MNSNRIQIRIFSIFVLALLETKTEIDRILEKQNFSLQRKLDGKKSGKSQQAEQPSPSDKSSEQQFVPLEDDDNDSSQNESSVPSFRVPPPFRVTETS